MHGSYHTCPSRYTRKFESMTNATGTHTYQYTRTLIEIAIRLIWFINSILAAMHVSIIINRLYVVHKTNESYVHVLS